MSASKRKRQIEKLTLGTNSLVWAAASLAVGMCYLLVVSLLSHLTRSPHELPEEIRWLFGLLLASSLILPLVTALMTVVFLPINERFISRLVQSYLAVLLLFANAYLIVVSFSTPEPPISGIRSPWVASATDPTREVLDARLVLRAAVDSFHLSSITITTVGFGDIHPSAWYAKLLTDVEALCGVGIVVIGIGRHFAGSRK